MATIADLLVKLRMDGSGLDSGMDSSQSKLKSWGQSMTKIGKMATVGVTLPIVAMGGAAIKWAADLDESINKVSVLFGDQSDELIQWSEGSAKSMGMSQQATLDYAGAFAGMLNTVASGPEELRAMSTDLTQLTADFASFHNLNPEEAFTVIASGLAGEAEAVRRYGVDMSAANVEQVALSMGLADTAKNLTAQDKALARYQILLNETTEEQGDFAKTSNSVSNQMKIARARIQDVGVSFGEILLPYVQQALMAFGDLLDKFESLDPKWQKIILAVAVVAAVMGPLLIIIGMMLPALGAIGAVIGLILSPIGLLVIAIAALIGLGIYAWANDLWGVRDAFEGLVDALEPVFDALDLLRNYLSAVIDDGDTWNDWLTHFPEGIQPFVQALGEAVASFMGFVDQIKAAAGDFVDAFQALREGNYWEFLYELRDGLWTLIGAIGDALAIPPQLLADFLTNIETGFEPLDNLLAGAGRAWQGWADVIKAVFSGDLRGAIDGFLEILRGIGDELHALGEMIMAGIEAVDWSGLASTMLQKGRDLLTGLWNGIQEYWPTIQGWMVLLGMLIFTAIGDVLRTLRQKGLDLLAGLWDGLKDKWAEVKAWVSLMGTYVFWAIGDVLRILRQKGLDLMAGLWDGILDKWASVKSWVSGIGGYVSTNVGDLSTILYDAGSAAIQGLVDGMMAMAQPIIDAVDYLVGLVPDWAKERLGIASPSRVFMDIGKNVGAGLVVGIDSMENSVVKATDNLSAAATGSFSTGITSTGNGNNGQVIQIITLEPSRWQEFLNDAQQGGQFARSFAGELGLRVGAP